jgi:hypothetical protein
MPVDQNLVPVKLWLAFEARDWQAASALLHDDFVDEWPRTNERFIGRDRFIEVNRTYPGDWHITVERSVAAGDSVVTQTRVVIGKEVHYAISFFDLKDGLIVKEVDWWMIPDDPQPMSPREHQN